jgi:eukaryotic-like serine/threonine-protein kinase
LNETDIDPRAGKIVGTADYLSPEQILTPLKVAASSDIYSLGCTLYYAVTGKVPFPGGTSRDKARRHLEDQPLHPRRLNPDLTDKFIDVIAAMMDKDLTLRTASAAEVIRQLAPWAEDRVDAPLLEPTERRVPAQIEFAPIPESEEFDGGDFAALAETDWQLEEGLSQASQGTDPFAQIDEETVPAPSDTWLAPPRYRMSRETVLLSTVAGIAIIVLLIVLFYAIFK